MVAMAHCVDDSKVERSKCSMQLTGLMNLTDLKDLIIMEIMLEGSWHVETYMCCQCSAVVSVLDACVVNMGQQFY